MGALVDPSLRWQVIVVDPPWAYGSNSERPNPTTAEAHYATVGNAGKEVNRRTGEGVDEIAAIAPVGDWLRPDSALFVWATNPKLPFAFRLLDLWGATYKTTLTWVKTSESGAPIRSGMGWFFRGCTEHVLFATRGSFAIPPELREPNVVLARRGEHSEKPDAFYGLIERVTPGMSRLDVFARKRREGWDVWGNEVRAEAAQAALPFAEPRP